MAGSDGLEIGPHPDNPVDQTEGDGGAGTGDGGASVDAVSVTGAGGDPPNEGGGPTTTVGAGGAGAGEPIGGNGQQPPETPVYRIPLRIHKADSGLSSSVLLQVLEEIQWIWWSQAGICFEVEIVDSEDTMNTGYDLWFVVDPKHGTYNGYYAGDHDIWTVDQPSLGSAPNPTSHPASRTGAHELGHGLELGHYNGQSDSNDSLMSSGKQGWLLHQFEVDTARGRASEKALEDTTPIYCAPIPMP